jgi:hypothetical protein
MLCDRFCGRCNFPIATIKSYKCFWFSSSSKLTSYAINKSWAKLKLTPCDTVVVASVGLKVTSSGENLSRQIRVSRRSTLEWEIGGSVLQIRLCPQSSRLRRGRRRCTRVGPGERRRRRMVDRPEHRRGMLGKVEEEEGRGAFIQRSSRTGPCTHLQIALSY